VTVNVLATCGHGLNLHGNGPGTVFVGNNGNLDGIQGLEMSISNRSSSDTGVVIDDRKIGRASCRERETVTRGTEDVQITGQMPGASCIQRSITEYRDVVCGTDPVTVNVLATCGHGLNLHGNGPGTVFVGNNGSLDGIQGLEMSISNRSSSDTGVVIDDR